jgi:hypothetical protein
MPPMPLFPLCQRVWRHDDSWDFNGLLSAGSIYCFNLPVINRKDITHK